MLQANDNSIISELRGFKDSVERRLDKLDDKIDKMVSRDLFDSELRRLNERDNALEAKVDAGLKSLGATVEKGFAQVETNEVKRDNRNRWLIGIVATVGGLVVSAAGVLATQAWNLANLLVP